MGEWVEMSVGRREDKRQRGNAHPIYQQAAPPAKSISEEALNFALFYFVCMLDIGMIGRSLFFVAPKGILNQQ